MVEYLNALSDESIESMSEVLKSAYYQCQILSDKLELGLKKRVEKATFEDMHPGMKGSRDDVAKILKRRLNIE